jgi:circadian clock protein KaiB
VASEGHHETIQDGVVELRLYVAGQTPKSLVAISNLQKICREHINGSCQVEVVDVTRTPELAARDRIIAVPALVRSLPRPIRKVLGDLSDTKRVIEGLDLCRSEVAR